MEDVMKGMWIQLFIMGVLLFISTASGPVMLVIQDYYYNQNYNRYKRQYSWLDKEIYNIVSSESECYKIDKNIIFAIIHSESRGNRYAVSVAGALGLMQVMPYHVIERKEVLFDTTKNIKT